MARRSPLSGEPSHLYIVAGYPTSGKSTCLAQAVRERFPIFGRDSLSVIPDQEAIRGFHDRLSTAAKLKAGYWVTLVDLENLNQERRLPKRLILHLDLLLAYLSFRPAGDPDPRMDDALAAFARLFAQPALRYYERFTVTTINVPIEEIQRRWHDRHRDGFPETGGKILADKKRFITDGAVAASAHAAIHAAWQGCLLLLSRSGKIANHLHVQTSARADAPRLKPGGSP